MNVVDASCFSFCDGSATTTVTGGTMPYTYTWLQSVNGSQNGTASGICNGNYQTEVTDVSGCFADVTYFIDQPENVSPSFLVDTASGCYPHQVNFINTTPSSIIMTTQVDFGDGSFGTYTGSDAFDHSYENPGVYDVTMTVTTTLGCDYTITYQDLIEAYDHPVADFYVSPDFVSMLEPTVGLYSSSSSDATQFSWNIFDGNPATANTEEVKDVAYPFDAPGLYPVVLTVTSDEGCTDTIQKFVTIQNDVLLYAPNTFTPDGDEHNQAWELHISGIDIYDFNLKIFNRWGQVVWETNDPSVSWDGSFNGKIVQNGLYSWSMECGDSQNDKRYTFEGHINVIR
jgi:gliding motility-associated-like protein